MDVAVAEALACDGKVTVVIGDGDFRSSFFFLPPLFPGIMLAS
jgi:hypothetical protein